MKEYWKVSLAMFGRLVLATVMCVFLVLSITVIFTALGTHTNGYVAVVTDSDGKEIATYTHKNGSGEDLKRTSYEEEGYTVTTTETRTSLSVKQQRACFAVTQAFCAGILIVLSYPHLWQIGAKDSNAVHFGHRKARPAFGFAVGFLANIPGLLLFVFCIAFRRVPVVLYAFVNAVFYATVRAVTGEAALFGELSVRALALIAATFLALPVFCGVGYLLGFKDIALGERLVYKKKK